MTPSVDIRVTTDRPGRLVVIIPDDHARRLRSEIKDGWQEIRGVADGRSRTFTEAAWVFAYTRTILDVVAVSAVVHENDRRLAGRSQFHDFIVGESDWNEEERRWRNGVPNLDLHVPGSVFFGGSTLVFAG